MRPHLDSAVEHFNRLIEDNPSFADEQYEKLISLQHDHNVLFDGRPLATSLRPTFMSEPFYTDVQDTVYLIRQAVLKIAAAFFNDVDNLKNDLGMEDWEIELAALPTRVIRLAATARMDSFITTDGFKFVEINGEVPAGIAYTAELGKLYRSLDIFQQFESKYPVRFISPLEHTMHALFQIYHEQFDGKEEIPSVAIVDHLDVPTTHEFDLIKEYLERMGHVCVVADPRSLECKDGWIYADGKKIDILYRRLLMNEYHAIRDECPAFLEGYKAQKTCYLNSFRTKLVHKKALFAFLTDEKYTRVLNSRQLSAINRHVPWTRKLRQQRTTFRGLPVDLVDFVRKNRSHFVIKPNDEYGGKGVVLGFQATESEWDTALKTGLASNYVVQEVVDIRREPFLLKVDGSWKKVPTVIDLDPYLNGPLMGGCLTRISASNLANVTAGGGSLPMYILRY